MNPPDEVPEARVNGQTSAVRSTSTSKAAPTTASASGRSRKVVHTHFYFGNTFTSTATQLNQGCFFNTYSEHSRAPGAHFTWVFGISCWVFPKFAWVSFQDCLSFKKKVLIWLKYWRKITNICLLWAILWLLLLFGAQKYNKTSLLIWNLFRCYLKKISRASKYHKLEVFEKIALEFSEGGRNIEVFFSLSFFKSVKKTPLP